ncbi:transcriptional regulator with XRE-family HTH domain [Nocardiopsis arvandica]|uniref:Transcriptional regulator with XRE-family HTH domain n=1 Tax=Nocardiopsis sinuspersici TaxID=501010 RepID=A0A7Z0BJL8_9ACTN|nr:helix-turn-helix transcriptional regulator [Nocardiopsis sinuspersici]NYH52215.1 transcriptional regulator with XRE-family HTH domain [Nocardiopsis sinuspersici]
MAARPSPTARQRRLMAELNRLRGNSGLSRAEVADRVGITDSTLWRYETGMTRPKPGDVAILLDVYGVHGAEREELIEMAKHARKRGWWHRHRQALKPGFDSYIGLEAGASVVRTFQTVAVPGIMQTEDYARAMIEQTAITSAPDPVDERVLVRMSRQELITRTDDPIHVIAILDEAVLRRQVGGPEIMHGQIQHLLKLAEYPNVTIRVVPFSQGAHPGMDGQFNLLEFPEQADPDLVYLEQAGSGLVPEDPEEVRRYTLIFGSLLGKALEPDESILFMRGLLTNGQQSPS